MLVLVLSSRSKESVVPSINENDVSLEQINDDHELLGILIFTYLHKKWN